MQADATLREELTHFDVHFFKSFAFLPDLAMHFGSLTAKKDFIRQTGTSAIHGSIGFLFYNVFQDSTDLNKTRKSIDTPYVRIFPFALSQKIHFRKKVPVTYIVISISADYLKSFLMQETEHFQFLFNKTSTFLVEELMTDDILRTVNQIGEDREPAFLQSYYYKLQAMRLLYYLFESLRKREKSTYQKLSEQDIASIYLVRDKICSSLDKPHSIKELQQTAGMNEGKLRKIFKQIFGVGIYDYFQQVRMKEAARLLREQQLSVSEAGYKMGFENLSHFSRVFEKHVGKKPKKYSNDLKSDRTNDPENKLF